MSPAITETLRMFYVSYRDELYTYAVSITRDRAAAEDAIHGAFQRLLRRGTLPPDLRPYVFRAVRNAAIDGIRQRRAETDRIFAAVSERAVSADGLYPDEVEAGLRELSPDEREAIVLKIYNELTFQQIADLRETPLPTVASWYRRGLEKLKLRLVKELS